VNVGCAQPGAFCLRGKRLAEGLEDKKEICKSLTAVPVSLQNLTTTDGGKGGVGEGVGDGLGVGVGTVGAGVCDGVGVGVESGQPKTAAAGCESRSRLAPTTTKTNAATTRAAPAVSTR
jgi:hypothetical protein